MKSNKIDLFQLVLLTVSLLTSCNTENRNGYTEKKIAIEGTWRLISETKIEAGDTTSNPIPDDQEMIKIINKDHFAFLRHDIRHGKDTTALFVAGGGRYSLNDSTYTEQLEYCNFREWENNSFTFTISFLGDTLLQMGREKVEGVDVDRIIIERYIRVSEN